MVNKPFKIVNYVLFAFNLALLYWFKVTIKSFIELSEFSLGLSSPNFISALYTNIQGLNWLQLHWLILILLIVIAVDLLCFKKTIYFMLGMLLVSYYFLISFLLLSIFGLWWY